MRVLSAATMPRICRSARLGLCASLAFAILPTSALAESPPPPPAPPSSRAIGTFASRLVRVNDDVIARAYARALRADITDKLTIRSDENGTETVDEAAVETRLRETLANVAAGGAMLFTEGALIDDGLREVWSFSGDGRGADGMPTLAWRDIDHSSVLGYSSERIGYCRGSSEACDAWFEDGRHRSRPPHFDAGDLAETEWEHRVMQEPCRHGPDVVPSKAPLQRAIIESGLPEARPTVIVLLNPCGDVRDAYFRTSSRNREIDRAVIRWVRNARYGSKVDVFGTGTGGRAMVPFTLVNADDAPASPDAPAASP